VSFASTRPHRRHSTNSTPWNSKRAPPSALSDAAASQSWARATCRTIARP